MGSGQLRAIARVFNVPLDEVFGYPDGEGEKS
jgi:hypothetical protein